MNTTLPLAFVLDEDSFHERTDYIFSVGFSSARCVWLVMLMYYIRRGYPSVILQSYITVLIDIEVMWILCMVAPVAAKWYFITTLITNTLILLPYVWFYQETLQQARKDHYLIQRLSYDRESLRRVSENFEIKDNEMKQKQQEILLKYYPNSNV